MMRIPPLLTTSEVAAILGVKTATLHMWRHKNSNPSLKYVKVGDHAIRYRPADVESFIKKQII